MELLFAVALPHAAAVQTIMCSQTLFDQQWVVQSKNEN